MVRVIEHYWCEKCRKGFDAFDEAEDCEFDHVLDGVIARTQDAIAEAFKSPALAAATQRAKTAQQAECEASQSGAAETAQRPTSSTQSGVR